LKKSLPAIAVLPLGKGEKEGGVAKNGEVCYNIGCEKRETPSERRGL